MNRECRIVIIEQSQIIIEGLCKTLEKIPMINIVGVFYDAHKVVEKIPSLNPNLIILNPTMISAHKRHSIKSMFCNAKLIALIYSYIDKETLAQFSSTIEICDEQNKIIQTIQHALDQDAHEEQMNDTGELSEREKEILVAVAKGLMNKEIACLHNISIHTVISHRKNISRKTGIKSVSGFVVYALLNNLIDQNDL